jgi:hypothetical protein
VNACSCFAFIGSAHSEENMHWYKRIKAFGLKFEPVLVVTWFQGFASSIFIPVSKNQV